jgi:hypothetical protein
VIHFSIDICISCGESIRFVDVPLIFVGFAGKREIK